MYADCRRCAKHHHYRITMKRFFRLIFMVDMFFLTFPRSLSLSAFRRFFYWYTCKCDCLNTCCMFAVWSSYLRIARSTIQCLVRVSRVCVCAWVFFYISSYVRNNGVHAIYFTIITATGSIQMLIQQVSVELFGRIFSSVWFGFETIFFAKLLFESQLKCN